MSLSLSSRIRIAFAVLVATIGVAVVGIGNLTLNSHYSAYFDDDDPRLLAHQRISDRYSRHDSVFIVLQSASSFLNADNYYLLDDLTATLADQPFASSAVSITELGIIGDTPTEDGDLIPSLQQLEAESQVVGLLLSEATTLAGISVQVDLSDTRSDTVLENMATIRQTVDTTIGDLPITAHYTGTLALNEAYINVVKQDLTRIVPMLVVTMLIMLGSLLRSWRAAITMLPVGICATVAAFGIAGLIGAELAAINSFTPVIILTVSIASTVHMAMSYVDYRDRCMTPAEAALEAANYNLLPMSLANGTTALGFLGLTFSPSPPIRIMGVLVATGIITAFILCMTLLPALQARFDPWKPGGKHRGIALSRLGSFVTKRRTGLITLSLLLALPAAWFTSRNVISDNVLEYFPPSHPFYRDTQLVEEQLSGVNEVLYSVDTGKRFGLFDAAAVNAIGRVAKWLSDQPEVVQVVSIAAAQPLAEAAQEGRLQERLDFYRKRLDESGDPNPPLALDVSADYSASVITAYLAPLESGRLIEFDGRARAWAADNLGDYTVRSGGPTLMFANLGQQNIRGMLTALIMALLGAALLLGIALRSVRIAWIGLVCNLLPILIVYSLWAVVDGRISIGAAVVMGMVLGILLDDTIYLLAAFRRGIQRSLVEPISYAIERVGPALIVTTVTLVAGLGLGLLSDFGPIWSMSILSVTIIGIALIVDLLLLPALLTASTHRGDEL